MDTLMVAFCAFVVLCVVVLVAISMSNSATRCQRADDAQAAADRAARDIARQAQELAIAQAHADRFQNLSQMINDNGRIRAIRDGQLQIAVAPATMPLNMMPRNVRNYDQDASGAVTWSLD